MVLPESLAGFRSSPATSDHRGRQPVIPEGDRGTEAGAEAGSPLPVSYLPVSKQCCGAGSSRDQTAGECQPRVSILRWSVANDSRLRGSSHDPERPSEVVAERGCGRADSVHPGNPRIEKLATEQIGDGLGWAGKLFLQHNPLAHGLHATCAFTGKRLTSLRIRFWLPTGGSFPKTAKQRLTNVQRTRCGARTIHELRLLVQDRRVQRTDRLSVTMSTPRRLGSAPPAGVPHRSRAPLECALS